MREVKKKSVAPVYGLAAAWLLYCLIFPLYRAWHFIVLIGAGLLVYAALSRIFPGRIEYIKEPEKPARTGDEKLDALLRAGDEALARMRGLRGAIDKASVKDKAGRLIEVTDKIFKDLLEDAGDYNQVRRFSEYYLPTTLKLLEEYERFERAGSAAGRIADTQARIEAILDKTLGAYEKQLEALYFNQILDIEAEITVLEGMIKREGFGEKDFG